LWYWGNREAVARASVRYELACIVPGFNLAHKEGFDSDSTRVEKYEYRDARKVHTVLSSIH